MLYSALGDFVKNDTRQRFGVFTDRFGDMVTNCLSLTVLIGRDIDRFSLFGKLFKLFDRCAGISWDGVFWDQVSRLIINGNAECTFGKITYMPFGSDLPVIRR